MQAALARGRARGRRRPGRAHHGREHGERPQRRPPRGRPRGARRHVVVARPAREGRAPLAPAPHRCQGALDLARRAVAQGVAPGAPPSGRSSRSSSGPPGARAGRSDAPPVTPCDGRFARSDEAARVTAHHAGGCPQPTARRRCGRGDAGVPGRRARSRSPAGIGRSGRGRRCSGCGSGTSRPLNAVFSALYRFVRSHYRLWYWLSQRSSSRLEALGRLHAYLMCALGEEARSRVRAVPRGQRPRLPDPGARRVPGDDEGELRDALPVRRALPRRADPDRRHGRGRVRGLVGHAVQLAALGRGSSATCT